MVSASCVNIMPVARPEPLSVWAEGVMATRTLQPFQGQMLGHPVQVPSTEAPSGAVLDLSIRKICVRIGVKL